MTRASGNDDTDPLGEAIEDGDPISRRNSWVDCGLTFVPHR
jgi:hypothetical protein